MTRIIRPDHNVKGKQKKITMSNSKPTKIIRDKHEKQIKIKLFQKCRFGKRTKFDTKRKRKTNHKGWNWKTILIKKMIWTTKNNNQKNKDHILYKNKMSMDEIQRQLNSIKDSRPKTS